MLLRAWGVIRLRRIYAGDWLTIGIVLNLIRARDLGVLGMLRLLRLLSLLSMLRLLDQLLIVNDLIYLIF